MKYFITPNAASKHGYDFIIDNDGERTAIELTRKTTDGYIHLPEAYHETLNRKLLKFTDFEGKGEYEITRREGRTISQSNTTPKTPTKGWVEYLTDEEKALYEQLKAKAEKRAQAAKLKAQIAALEAQLTEAQA